MNVQAILAIFLGVGLILFALFDLMFRIAKK